MVEASPARPAHSAQRSAKSYLDEIDLRVLLAPPAGLVLHADPLVRHYPALLNDRVCDWLIGRARGRLSRALVYDVTTRKDVAHGARTNSFAVFNNMEADLVHLLVQSRMAFACGQPLSHLEAATVLHYAVGEEIVDHYDFVDPEKPGYHDDVRRSGHRVLTFLAYLNADYRGGETVFPKLGFISADSAATGCRSPTPTRASRPTCARCTAGAHRFLARSGSSLSSSAIVPASHRRCEMN